MDKKKFAELKVGDKVRIVSKKDGEMWDIDGGMDKWLGKVMTVRRKTSFFGYDVILMEEDYKTALTVFGYGWGWFPHMIAEKVEPVEQPTIVKHLVKDRKTIVKLSNGKVVFPCAYCDSHDRLLSDCVSKKVSL